MRLINVKTMAMEQFFDEESFPKYAILSHTWGEEEVLFAEMSALPINDSVRRKKGYYKIENTCKQALQDGIKYVWIDTCCIDKTSSAELSEAINSMFQWYTRGKVCYVYLEDVALSELKSQFANSRWFKRGWTLQELLAPDSILFFGKKWEEIGSKNSLAIRISEVTGIDESLLRGIRRLGSYSVATRMSWAAARRTTRTEDIAYCLLGVFDVNMPLLYGEGNKAFMRLQEEIARSNADHSLLAWQSRNASSGHIQSRYGAFSPHPRSYISASNIVPFRKSLPKAHTQMTSYGLEVTLPILPLEAGTHQVIGKRFIALLDCHYEDDFSGCIGLPLVGDTSTNIYRRLNEHMPGEVDLLVIPHAKIAEAIESRIIFGSSHDSGSRGSTGSDTEWTTCWIKSDLANCYGYGIVEVSIHTPGRDQRRQVTWNKMTQTLRMRMRKLYISSEEDARTLSITSVAILFRRTLDEPGFVIMIWFEGFRNIWTDILPDSNTNTLLQLQTQYEYNEFSTTSGQIIVGKSITVTKGLKDLGLRFRELVGVKTVLRKDFVMSQDIFTLEVIIEPVQDNRDRGRVHNGMN